MTRGIGVLGLLLILPSWALAGYTGYFDADVIVNTTSEPDSTFTGLPGAGYGIGSKMVIYDLGSCTLIDSIGSDLNVYESNDSYSQFHQIQVWVSQDNNTWVNITSTQTTGVDVDNDNITGSPDYIQSYDLTGSGLSWASYVKILGIDASSGGFDLDTICAVNYTLVPVPGAMMLVALGGGLLGRLRRRL